MSPSTQIRILLADDHAMFREGVKQLLSNTPDFVVVGEACDAAQVLEKSHRMECDVVILDISMPGRDGIEVLKQLKQLNPHCNVLILSMYPEDQYAFRAIKAGASGYLTKNCFGIRYRTLVMKLLIADDNVPLRTKLVSILGGIDGIEIVGETGDVPETLKVFEKSSPDTVILDIHMPGGNGLDVLRVVKGTKSAPMVIMLTVGPRSEYQTESFLFGADYFFEKTSELAKMVIMLKRMAKKDTLKKNRIR